jgi:hypothetical protein
MVMIALWLAFGLLAVAPPAGRAATPPQLLAVDSGLLLAVDPASGAATLIGPIRSGVITGLARLPDGTLVTIDQGPAQPGTRLLAVDPVTGTGTTITPLTPGFGGRIAVGPGGVLFGADSGSLVTIDPVTGAVTTVGPTGIAPHAHFAALATDATGRLVGVIVDPGDPTVGRPGTPPQLVTLDPATGLATVVGPLAPSASISALALDAAGRLVGAVCDAAPRLIAIDAATAATTPIAPLSGPITCLSGLVAEPAAGVIIELVQPTARPVLHTVTGLTEDDRLVRIENGTPGLRALRIAVNGRILPMVVLRDGQVRTLDVGSWLRPGDANVIRLETGWGVAGTRATITISP